MKTNFQRTNYFLILALGATLIGFAPIFVKWSSLTPTAISFYRMFLAIPFLFILNFSLNKTFKFSVNNKKTIFYSALASLAFTTDLTLWHFSMNITSVANATIIVNRCWIYYDGCISNWGNQHLFLLQSLLILYLVKNHLRALPAHFWLHILE